MFSYQSEYHPIQVHFSVAVLAAMDSRFFVLLIVAVVVACQVVRALPHAKPPLADISPTVSTTQSRSFSAQRSIVENSSSDASLRNTDNSITQQIAAGNNLEVGKCWPPDERIYTDNTVVENGGASTLNGTLEVGCCSKYCVKII